MPKYVALIRGIGPGDPRKTNEKLRGVLEALGSSHVESVITSGNIVFQSDNDSVDELEAAIEAAWPKLLGFEATTLVRSQRQLQKLVDADYFKGATHGPSSYLLVTLFKRPQKPDFTIPFQPLGKPYKVVGSTGGALFTITNNTVVKTTDLMSWIERRFGKDITSRTPLTIQRILKKMDS